MRKLVFEDLFDLLEIIDKTGVDFDLNAFMDAKKAGAAADVQANIGGQMIFSIIRKLHKARTEVYQFIAKMTEQDPAEISQWGIKQLTDFFKELFDQEGIAGLFS